MLRFKLVYSDAYYLPIGQHVFPAEKYRRIHDRLMAEGMAEAGDFIEPQPADDQDLLLVHKPEYVTKLRTGTLSPREEMEMEVPYSPDLVEAFWLAAGGSILAARRALDDRVAINIGGGFHHAFPDHGEGFCMINDVAVAIRRLQRDDKIRTAMTVDCDVHQGNGTAAIFAGTRTASALLPSAGASTLESAALGSSPLGAARPLGKFGGRTPAKCSPSHCISTITIRCGSRRHRLMWTCLMALGTTITWRGSTTR